MKSAIIPPVMLRRPAVIFAVCLMTYLAPPAVGQQVTLDSNATLVVGSEEPGPVQEAAKDLAADFAKVFGKKPRIVNRPQDAAGVAVVIGVESALKKPESYSISTPKPNTVVLRGADMRGTIYAVYSFAQEYLGTDPLYYWTDSEPARRTQISLPPSLNKTSGGPLFKYRGFFINDEDLLTGWAPGGQDATGISLEVWNKIFETILRLKGNIVAPGTWIFPDEAQIRLAGQRGLIISQHHAIPVGVNVARWPKDVPYSYSAHPEILERAWKNAAAAYPSNQEVLWTVGLRGLSDSSYAAADPSVRGNDEALGRLVGKAMDAQMRIVRELRPNADFITNLWQEGARLVQQGYLSIPAEVATVWADDGYGYIQDRGKVVAGQGMYYHVAMMNGRANQLSEMVPVERIDAEFGRYINAGATHYMLLNTSDIRPVPMTTKAVMDVAWGGLTPETQPDEFYRRWSAAEFGEKAAERMAAIYKDYFAAPAHTVFGPPREYGDQYYHSQARLFLLARMIGSPIYALPSQSPLWSLPRLIESPLGPGGGQSLEQMAESEARRCREAQPRWDTLWKKAVETEARVSPQRQPFYHAHVLAMLAINRESNRMLALTSDAVLKAAAGDRASARTAAQAAIAAISEIRRVEATAEYGKWKHWYRGDWLTGVHRTDELLKIFLKQLDDPLSPMPPPVQWTGWEAYRHIMEYEGARSVDVK